MRGWAKSQLVTCHVDWDIITLYMGDGTTYKLKRGKYKGSWVRMTSLPFTNVVRWEFTITPAGGKQMRLDTLLVQYPEGEKSLEELANVLGLAKNKWLACIQVVEKVTTRLRR